MVVMSDPSPLLGLYFARAPLYARHLFSRRRLKPFHSLRLSSTLDEFV